MSTDLALLWQLVDAKLRLDFAWNYLREVREDMHNGGVSSPDREYAYEHAVKGHDVALIAYTEALNRFKASVGQRVKRAGE
jgi:hypothetical protein